MQEPLMVSLSISPLPLCSVQDSGRICLQRLLQAQEENRKYSRLLCLLAAELSRSLLAGWCIAAVSTTRCLLSRAHLTERPWVTTGIRSVSGTWSQLTLCSSEPSQVRQNTKSHSLNILHHNFLQIEWALWDSTSCWGSVSQLIIL